MKSRFNITADALRGVPGSGVACKPLDEAAMQSIPSELNAVSSSGSMIGHTSKASLPALPAFPAENMAFKLKALDPLQVSRDRSQLGQAVQRRAAHTLAHRVSRHRHSVREIQKRSHALVHKTLHELPHRFLFEVQPQNPRTKKLLFLVYTRLMRGPIARGFYTWQHKYLEYRSRLENTAAFVLQRTFKLFVSRIAFFRMRQAFRSKIEEQRAERRRLLAIQAKARTRIRMAVRHFWERKHAKQQAILGVSATVIQRWWRALKVKFIMVVIRLLNQAKRKGATGIQQLWRGYSERRSTAYFLRKRRSDMHMLRTYMERPYWRAYTYASLGAAMAVQRWWRFRLMLWNTYFHGHELVQRIQRMVRLRAGRKRGSKLRALKDKIDAYWAFVDWTLENAELLFVPARTIQSNWRAVLAWRRMQRRLRNKARRQRRRIRKKDKVIAQTTLGTKALRWAKRGVKAANFKEYAKTKVRVSSPLIVIQVLLTLMPSL